MDTTKAPKRFVAPAKKRAQQQSRLRQLNARARGGNEQQRDTGRYTQVSRNTGDCYFYYSRKDENWIVMTFWIILFNFFSSITYVL